MTWNMNHLGKGEGFMGYELQTSSIDFSGAVHVLGLQLLKQSIVDPQVDVALPVALLWCWWNVTNCSLIHLPRKLSNLVPCASQLPTLSYKSSF